MSTNRTPYGVGYHTRGGRLPRDVALEALRVQASQAAARDAVADSASTVDLMRLGLPFSVVDVLPSEEVASDPRSPAVIASERYGTLAAVFDDLPLSSAQRATAERLVEQYADAPPGRPTTGMQMGGVIKTLRAMNLPPSLVGEIARRASAYIYAKRGAGLRSDAKARTLAVARGVAKSEGGMSERGFAVGVADAVEGLTKARKRIGTGPRGGKIVGYTQKDGKRVAIYERPGGESGGGTEDAAHPRDAVQGATTAAAMEAATAKTPEARKAAVAKLAAAHAAADAIDKHTEANDDADTPDPEDVAETLGEAPERAEPVAEPANEALPETDTPDPQDGPERPTPAVDREPLSDDGDMGDLEAEGDPGIRTQAKADLEELAAVRADLQKMFAELDRIEHLITAEYVPMFNQFKEDIRRVSEQAAKARAAVGAGRSRGGDTQGLLAFLWEKLTAFVEFITKMAAAGVKAAGGAIKRKMGERKQAKTDKAAADGKDAPQDDTTKKAARALAYYHASAGLVKSGRVDAIPAQIVSGLLEVLREAMAEGRMDAVVDLAEDYDDGEWGDDDARVGFDPYDDEMEIDERVGELMYRSQSMAKGARHKYIRRVPKAGGGYRYYYRESAASRGPTKGESVRLGDKVVEIGNVTDGGVEVDGKVMSHTQWLNALSSHYANLEMDVLKRSAIYGRAVQRAIPKGALSGGDSAAISSAMAGAFKRTGMDAGAAERAVDWVVQRRGWSDGAKGALLGEMTVGDRARWVQQNYRKVATEAESANAGNSTPVSGSQVSEAVLSLAPALSSPSKRPHSDMLAEALAGAFPGKSFDEIVGMIRKAQAAEAEASKPPKVDGDSTSVYLPGKDGKPERMPARYKLVEASDLIASHDPSTFSPRADYPKGLQERAYHRDKAEQAKVTRNAASLIPEYVANTNPDAVNGAPLVDDNGVVLGGNSRTMSMQLAYKDGNGGKLKSFLEQNAQQFGLDAKDVSAMKAPVLVRVVDTKGRDPKLLVRQMNEGMTQDMDPRVLQVAMGRKLDEDAIGKLASDMGTDQTLSEFLDSPKAEGFISDLRRVGIIDARNVSRYMRGGKLNADGKQLVERVLVGKVVGDPDLLSDTNPSVVAALAQAVPYMVQSEAHGDGYNLRDDLREALAAHNDMQRRGNAPKSPKDAARSVEDYIRNTDMFGGGENELAQGESPLVRNKRARELTKVLFEKTGPRQLASVFRAYSEQAMQNPEGQFSLFGAPKSPMDVLSDAVSMAKSARTLTDLSAYAQAAGLGADLMKSEGFTPPERVASAAARGLRLREKAKGGTAVGVARARDLSNRKAVSLDTIRRMVSYFARHGAQRPEARGTDAEPTPWLVAWNLWGGDAGRAWAESIWERERGDTEKSARTLADLVEYATAATGEVEIPESVALALGFGDLEKGAGHKYIRRVPKAGGGYRYFYKVAGVTRDVGKDLVEGAAFALKSGDKEGHFHVTGRDGDKVTLRHDETGRELTVDAKALGAMLQREHAEVVGAKREAIKREIAQAEKTGTPKQRERLKAEAERLGVGAEPEAEKPGAASVAGDISIEDGRRLKKDANRFSDGVTSWAFKNIPNEEFAAASSSITLMRLLAAELGSKNRRRAHAKKLADLQAEWSKRTGIPAPDASIGEAPVPTDDQVADVEGQQRAKKEKFTFPAMPSNAVSMNSRDVMRKPISDGTSVYTASGEPIYTVEGGIIKDAQGKRVSRGTFARDMMINLDRSPVMVVQPSVDEAPAPVSLAEPESPRSASNPAPTAAAFGINVSRSDIPRRIAEAANRNTSFGGDRRADSVQDEYVDEIERVAENNKRFATTPEAKAAIAAEIEKYRDGFVKRYIAKLEAASRTASSMVVGPAGFNVRRNDKALDVERKRTKELTDWMRGAEAKIRKVAIDAGRTTKSARTIEDLRKAAAGVSMLPGTQLPLPGGLMVNVETPRGFTRAGVDTDGRPWQVVMPAHYGEFIGTRGADGDPVDVFVGDDLMAPYVYVVGLQDPATGLHDEDKVMYGFASRSDAMACYRAAYNRRDLLLDVRRLTAPEFLTWLSEGGMRGERISGGRELRRSLRAACGLPEPGPARGTLAALRGAVAWRRAPNRLRGTAGGEPVTLTAPARPVSKPAAAPAPQPSTSRDLAALLARSASR